MGALRPDFPMSPKKIALCGALAAAYAAITAATAAFSFGPVQFRAAEALCLLCTLAPDTVWGLTLGCALANLFSPVSVLDALVGSAATLLGCLCVRRIRRPALMPLPLIAVNAVFVGAELAVFCPGEAALSGFLVFAAQVAAGEAAVLYLLGLPLLLLVRRVLRVGDRQA